MLPVAVYSAFAAAYRVSKAVAKEVNRASQNHITVQKTKVQVWQSTWVAFFHHYCVIKINVFVASNSVVFAQRNFSGTRLGPLHQRAKIKVQV